MPQTFARPELAAPKPELPHADLRRLWPSDMPAFRDHLLRLDLRSRHLRFGGGMSDDFLKHYAESCFGTGDLVFGAFVDGDLHGAAELRSGVSIWTKQSPAARHIHAEAAFSVEDAYRRCGIGKQLFRRLLDAASNHGVETMEIVCLPENVGMMKLAQQFRARFTYEGSLFNGKLTIRQPTALTLMREAAHDVVDFTTSLFDAQLRALGRV